MNRYIFWALLMGLPWLAFIVSTYLLKDTAYPFVFILNILFLQAITLNARRKQVGMNFISTVKAIIPGISYKKWQQLYFTKP
jgi:hypothetical protein